MLYNRDLKKKLCEKICIDHYSTLKTANEYGIPIKTLEKWVTAFNKDNHCFDSKPPYVCNGCSKFNFCKKQRYSYSHDVAYNEYLKVLIKSRSHLKITKEDCYLIASHINSTPRISLNNHSSYESALLFLGQDNIDKFNIKKIDNDDIDLSIRLLKK